MPRFFFDIDDGQPRERDEVGAELATLHDACCEAVQLLPALARDVPCEDLPQCLAVDVRDEGGRSVVKVTLSLTVEHPA